VDVESWPVADGVVEFPNGTRVRGRGLGGPDPVGPDPTLGVYLLDQAPPWLPWTSVWIDWPDFGLPADPDDAVSTLHRAFHDAQTARLELACHAGRGRTGTALAALAVASGIDPVDAVDWVRRHYRPDAVEPSAQRRWVAGLGP